VLSVINAVGVVVVIIGLALICHGKDNEKSPYGNAEGCELLVLNARFIAVPVAVKT